MLPADWTTVLHSELVDVYWTNLQEFVESERSRGPVHPDRNDVFTALHLTSLAATRVVILGQDPYPGRGRAHGLSFSVRPGSPHPPSLRNIFRELHSDIGCPIPLSGSLEKWARSGVLLLNTTLTVREGQPGSHRGRGWERFTDHIISAVNDKPEGVVFILWGVAAGDKRILIDSRRHTVIESPHPSPLSANRGFLGSRPFSRANDALMKRGLPPIDWCLDDKGKTSSTGPGPTTSS